MKNFGATRCAAARAGTLMMNFLNPLAQDLELSRHWCDGLCDGSFTFCHPADADADYNKLRVLCDWLRAAAAKSGTPLPCK